MICVDLKEVCVGHLKVCFSLVQYERFVDAVLAAEGEENRVQGLVLFWLYVASPEEAVLLHVNSVWSGFRHGHNGVTDLLYLVSK